jgi:hypothetical protein
MQVLVSPFGRLRISCPAVLDGLAGDLAADRDDLHRLHRLDLTVSIGIIHHSNAQDPGALYSDLALPCMQVTLHHHV